MVVIHEKYYFVLVLCLIVMIVLIVVHNRQSFNDRNVSFNDRNGSSAAMIPESHSIISLTQDSLYSMYGEGNSSEYDEQLLNYIRSQMSRQGPGGRRLSNPSTRDFSQFGAPSFVDKLLKRRQNGFFVQCGALDGERFSDTLHFEMKRNWTGLLIEANPERHRGILKKNRRALVLRGCLSAVRRPAMVKFQLDGPMNGVSSLSKHRATYGTSKPETYVECFSLNSVMAAIGVQHIDYMVLDVEGAELPILETIDFTKLSFDVLSIAYNGPDAVNKLNNIRQFFNRTGGYKEVGKVPVGANDAKGHDVVLMRVY